VENIRRWLAGIGAAFRNPTEYFSRPRRATSDIATETGREIAAEEAGADAAATESAVETPTTTATFTTCRSRKFDPVGFAPQRLDDMAGAR